MARRKHPSNEPPLQFPELPVDPLTARIRQLRDDVRTQNLINAVRLAEQAAAGHGPLVDHFCELGRRYGHRLLRPAPREVRKAFQVIEGGRV